LERRSLQSKQLAVLDFTGDSKTFRGKPGNHGRRVARDGTATLRAFLLQTHQYYLVTCTAYVPQLDFRKLRFLPGRSSSAKSLFQCRYVGICGQPRRTLELLEDGKERSFGLIPPRSGGKL